MDNFYNEIKDKCINNKRVAMFIDMDGTIVEYQVFEKEELMYEKGKFFEGRPLNIIIDKLKKIHKIENIDLYILTLARSNNIVEEKKQWLKKYVDFVKEENWIILNKEKGEYNKENRNIIKAQKMKEKSNQYDYLVFLDDDHKILKEAKIELKDKIQVYHISSAII